MCKAPQTLRDGTIVGCRNCSQCIGRAVDDWTGRCIAESKCAAAPFFVNLTYGPDEDGNKDHLRAALLTYSDVQKYMKALRHSGFRPRYFAVGEYGSTKGRAHWHVLIFWQDNSDVIRERNAHNVAVRAKLKKGKVLRVPAGPIPPHTPSTRAKQIRFHEQHWDRGFSVWEPLNLTSEDTAAAVKYVCKYLNKDLGGSERQAKCQMSKKPLLGAAWLHDRARAHVEQGLAPQDLFYEFPDLPGKRFMLRPGSSAAELFLQSYIDQWEIAYPSRPLPPSKLVEEFTDPGAWAGHNGGEGNLRWQSAINDETPSPEIQAEEAKQAQILATRAKYFHPVYGPGFNLWPRQG
ncbi:hypothetical protein [Mesorhizobium sp. M1378]|uniref:rolling circle replication-associated protein n=1 Tax=Mesorhizobium sp. M1378 TaxID=2957092 RepID=UPI003338CD22